MNQPSKPIIFIGEQNMLQILMDIIPDYIFFKDRQSRFIKTNLAHARCLGIADPREAIGKTDFNFFPPEYAQKFFLDEQRLMETNIAIISGEMEIPQSDGSRVWVLEHKMPICDDQNNVIGLVGISRNITKHKKMELERERIIAEMQEALKKILTLRGLIPICASCKKIRDDGGYWQRVEEYIASHTEAEFTHSICPECRQRLYPDVQDQNRVRPQL